MVARRITTCLRHSRSTAASSRCSMTRNAGRSAGSRAMTTRIPSILSRPVAHGGYRRSMRHSPVFTGRGVTTTSYGVIAVALGDVNNDGVLDLVSANSYGNYIAMPLGNADGSFGSESFVGDTPAAQDIQLADVDGDGNLNVVSANDYGGYYGASLSVFKGLGDGASCPPPATPPAIPTGLSPLATSRATAASTSSPIAWGGTTRRSKSCPTSVVGTLALPRPMLWETPETPWE